jgi:hypothetical protein
MESICFPAILFVSGSLSRVSLGVDYLFISRLLLCYYACAGVSLALVVGRGFGVFWCGLMCLGMDCPDSIIFLSKNLYVIYI